MNIITHIDIANTLQKEIENVLPVKMDSLSFVYGCIKPDICAEYKKTPHILSNCGDILSSVYYQILGVTPLSIKCEKQFGKFISKNMREYISAGNRLILSKKFCELLGVLVHYICDFFCHVHSSKYTGAMLGHYAYETQYIYYFRKTIKFFDIKEALTNNKICSCKCILNESISVDDLKEAIHGQYKLYLLQKQSFDLDMKYSMSMSYLLCFSIIQRYIFDIIGEAA